MKYNWMKTEFRWFLINYFDYKVQKFSEYKKNQWLSLALNQ